MSLSVSFRRAARAEFLEAAAWYESQRPNLGVEFIAEIERCVAAAAPRSGSSGRDERPLHAAIYRDPALPGLMWRPESSNQLFETLEEWNVTLSTMHPSS
jgi:hypothetical protein